MQPAPPAPFTLLLLAFTATLLLGACDRAPTGSAGEQRGVLAFALLPDEDAQKQRARYAPLMDAVKRKTGLDVELVLPPTYTGLVELFAAGKVDVAYFGGYTYLLARERHGAVPLVMRDIDAHFVSYVFVHRDNDTVQRLSDLRGSRFSFGSRESTSGHIMPRHFFSALGIAPEVFFSEVRFSGAHDLTAQHVADGIVDAGVANGQIVRQILENARAATPPIRIVWQSPPYVDYVWAVHPSMSEKTRRAIKELFLGLSGDDETQARFLDDVDARFFLPAADSDFDALRHAVEGLRESGQGEQRR